MNQPPLNPDALEAATRAVSLAEREMHTNESLGKQRHIARRAVSAYLAAALPEPLSNDVERVAAALHGDNCPEYPDPGEWCDCDWSSYRRMAEVAIEAMPPVAQPEVTSVEELDQLPLGTTVLGADRISYQMLGQSSIMGAEWWASGSEHRGIEVELPARVLHRPEVNDA